MSGLIEGGDGKFPHCNLLESDFESAHCLVVSVLTMAILWQVISLSTKVTFATFFLCRYGFVSWLCCDNSVLKPMPFLNSEGEKKKNLSHYLFKHDLFKWAFGLELIVGFIS